MDALSQYLYEHPTFDLVGPMPSDAPKILQSVGVRRVPRSKANLVSEVARITAAPNNASIGVDGFLAEEEAWLYIDAEVRELASPLGEFEWETKATLGHSPSAAARCRIEWVHFRPPAVGLGTRYLARIVEMLRPHGIREICLFAAGHYGSTFNGYYSWPALGFEISLSEDLIDKARSDGFSAKTTHDLLRYGGEGLHWWRLHGRGGEAVFELSPESPHSRILKAYLELKGVEVL